MTIKQNLNILFQNIQTKKKYVIIRYSKLTYSSLLLLKNYLIKNIYKIKNWILIYLLYKKNLILKTFDLKNKKNFFTYKQLKKIRNKNGIIFSSLGIYSIKDIIKLKQGGILFCLIYYTN